MILHSYATRKQQGRCKFCKGLLNYVPYVFKRPTCVLAPRSYVPTCYCTLGAYVYESLCTLHSYVPACLSILRACMLLSFTCLRAHVSFFLTCLRTFTRFMCLCALLALMRLLNYVAFVNYVPSSDKEL